MALTLNTNVSALSSQRNLHAGQRGIQQASERLSSGLRINRASDDAAGLGISENLKADIRSLGQALRNSSDAVSVGQVAESSLGEMQGIVVRMRELAIQSANGTLGNSNAGMLADVERGFIQKEFLGLKDEIDRISATTDFNGIGLLDGTASSGLEMQVGIHGTANDRLAMSVARTTTSTLAETRQLFASLSFYSPGGTRISKASTTLFSTSYSVTTQWSTLWHLEDTDLQTIGLSRMSIRVFDLAIQELSEARTKLGAFQNRAAITISNLAMSRENISAANSRIRDADIAGESAQLVKQQVLMKSQIAMLAQSKRLPELALTLLG